MVRRSRKASGLSGVTRPISGICFLLKAPRYATPQNCRVPVWRRPHRGAVPQRRSLAGATGDGLGPDQLAEEVMQRPTQISIRGRFRGLPQTAAARVRGTGVAPRYRGASPARAVRLQRRQVDLARHYRVALVAAGDSEYPSIPDPTALRTSASWDPARRAHGSAAGAPTDLWAERARCWSEGGVAETLETVGPAPPTGRSGPRCA